MPWTRRQVRYLLSSGSPLTSEQKTKMKGELHRDPSLGHKRKGYKKKPDVQSAAYDFRQHLGRPKKGRWAQ